MQHETGKLKRSALNLREQLSALERDWLSACLVSNVGVRVAIYSDKDPQQLIVEYDSKLMNGTDVLDILRLRGVRANVAALAQTQEREEP